MKTISQILIITISVHLLAPCLCLAQQPAEGNIAQLREQIARLEKIDFDPEASPEVISLNREFLRERQAQLKALVKRRIAALQQYLNTTGDMLRAQERQAVEDNIRALTEELSESGSQAESDSNRTVDNRASLHASARKYQPASEVIPSPIPQDGRRTDASAGKGNDGNQVVINTEPPPVENPKPLEVKSRAEVTVGGTKSFVNTCTVTPKSRTPIAPAPNPLGQIFKVLFGLGPIPLGKVEVTACRPSSGIEVPDDPEARRIEAEIVALHRRVVNSASVVNDLRPHYELMADQITAFTNCKEIVLDANGDPVLDDKQKYTFNKICGRAGEFNTAKNKIGAQVGKTLGLEFPVLESAELEMTALKKEITDGYKKTGKPKEQDWVNSVNERLDCYSRTLEEIRKEEATLRTSREGFESFQKLLDKYKGAEEEGSYTAVLRKETNEAAEYTVTCTNYFTKQPAFDPVPFVVKYQETPRGAVSAGLLFSTLNKRQIGVQPVNTGTGSDGTSTVKLILAETDKANSQLIPFSFYNYRLWGDRKFNLNGSGGIGVNPNNGAAQVEFFFGGSVGLNNIFIQVGGHVGRWQELRGGFALGDILPSNPPTVPIERRYTIRPSIGVSYKLPLP